MVSLKEAATHENTVLLRPSGVFLKPARCFEVELLARTKTRNFVVPAEVEAGTLKSLEKRVRSLTTQTQRYV